MRMSKSGLGQQVTLRVSDGDVERIEALTEDMPLKRSAVIRSALRLGLELLEEDPARLFRRRRESEQRPAATGAW